MVRTVLSISAEDLEGMLVGWIFPAADLRHPVVSDSVVLRPDLKSNLQLAPGVYFYRFNSHVAGKFSVSATIPSTPAQSEGFDPKTDGELHLSFRFEVGA